ncbi:conjugal transfer protein [Enterococcus gallinarum]|nr:MULTISPECIES: conjugal transfer protein [Enterococcus]STD72881.1 Conjugative transposon protein [Enterococcus gallinarum]
MVQHISIEVSKLNNTHRLWNAQNQRSFSIFSRSEMDGYFITQMKGALRNMNKKLKRLLTGMLTLATVFTALPASAVHASEKQYWTDAEEKAGYVEKVMNDGSIGSTFHESIMQVEGETAYCIDINTSFENGYKTRSDASSRMSADQIADVALSLEYVKQYGASHKGLNHKQLYLLEQCVVWQRLSVHLGWQCDNVRASYDEISKAVQDEVYAGAKAQEADGTVDAETMTDTTAFLETFFKLYPTATEKELAYYVAGNALEPINGDYLYSELINPIFTQDGENVKVSVSVKFLDNQTKATQISQFELVLHKDSNWKIIG